MHGASRNCAGALRGGGEEDILRRSQTVDCWGMMLGQMIGINSRGIIALQKVQALPVDLR